MTDIMKNSKTSGEEGKLIKTSETTKTAKSLDVKADFSERGITESEKEIESDERDESDETKSGIKTSEKKTDSEVISVQK